MWGIWSALAPFRVTTSSDTHRTGQRFVAVCRTLVSGDDLFMVAGLGLRGVARFGPGEVYIVLKIGSIGLLERMRKEFDEMPCFVRSVRRHDVYLQ